MTKEQQIGRTILIIILLLLLVPELYTIGFKVNTGGLLVIDAVRLLLTLGLFYCVWLGMSWAKWLLIFFSTAGGLLLLAVGASASPLIAAMGLVCLASAISLGFIPVVQEFLSYQRRKRVAE